jgi:glycosyltransferase involved in cell wall biosynthesis
MTISVVLVTYNRAELLSATVESILNQTLCDFELLISDDCSPDNTEEVCRTFVQRDKRVRYRRNRARLKMPGNLNAGIADVRSEFIANLHDGDVYEPTLLERWHDALVHCPDAAFVFNAYRHLAPDGTVREVTRESLPCCFPGHMLLESIYFRRWRFGSPVWGTVMARRAAYEATGIFDERFGFYADVDMWMKLAENFRVAYVDEPLLTLPSRESVPRLFSIGTRAERRTLRRMFWEARMRHYHEHAFRRALEAGRHAAFATTTSATDGALAMRRALLKR